MTFGRRALAVLSALLLTFVVTVAAASAQDASDAQGAPDQEGVKHSWALGPTGSSDPGQPGNRQSLTYDVAPGSTIEDSVTLYNFGNVSLPFRVYATDAFNKPNGEVDLLKDGESPTDVGSWVTVSEERLNVGAGMQATLPITITVPADARPGDHVGALMASSPIPGRTAEGATVSIDRRTGPDLVIRVQGPLEPAIAVEDLSANYSPSLNPLSGSAEVTYRLHNTGNVRLSGTHYVTMGGLFGLGESRTEPMEFTGLLPGGSMEVTVPVDGVPASVMSTATVHVDTTPVDGVGDTTPTTAEASARTPAIPWTVVALILIVVLALFARSRYLRKGHSGSGPSRLGPGDRRPPGLPSSSGATLVNDPAGTPPQVLERQR